MPLIKLKKSARVLQVDAGTNLMKALLEADLPVASSCDGDGVCAKCKIIIIDGHENLTPPNETEDFLKKTKSIPDIMRISCQTDVLGDITIDATYW